MKQADPKTPVSRRFSSNFRRYRGRYRLSLALFPIGLFGWGAILFLLCLWLGLCCAETHPKGTVYLWVGILGIGGGGLYWRYVRGRTHLAQQKRAVLCAMSRDDLAEMRRRRDRFRRLTGWLRIFALPFLVAGILFNLFFLLVSAFCDLVTRTLQRIIRKK